MIKVTVREKDTPKILYTVVCDNWLQASDVVIIENKRGDRFASATEV